MDHKQRRPYRLVIWALALIGALAFTSWRTYEWVQRKRLGPPLIAAIKANDLPRVNALLDRGADPDTRDVPNPPLDLWSLVKSMFRPDPRLKRDSFPSALQLSADQTTSQELRSKAAEMDTSLGILRSLLKHGGDARVKRPDGNSLLGPMLDTTNWEHPADKRVYALLLDHGADANAIYKGTSEQYGDSPKAFAKPLLLMAYEYQKEEYRPADRGDYIKLLLDHKANPNVVDDNGQTLLKLALDDDKTDLVKRLLECGADPNRKSDGRSPLLDAVQWRNYEAVKMLLAKRADPNQVDLLGTSPLMIAAFNGDQDIVRALLAAGARTELADSEGMTARQFALDSPAIVALLDATSADRAH